MVHRVVLEDLGRGYYHHWRAGCSCGDFASIPRRTIARARRDHAAHARQSTSPPRVKPRALTPVDALPEVLR